MRKNFIVFFIALICNLSFLQASKTEVYLDIQPKTENEALFLRRIVDFWEEKSYELVETQILEFVQKYPESELCDPFFALLGDLHVYQNDYSKALQAYEKIVSSEMQAKVLITRLRCLKNLREYQELTHILSPYLHSQKHPKEVEQELLYLGAESYYQLCRSSEGEDQKEFAKKGIQIYEKLLDTDVSSDVIVSLAFLHKVLEDFPRASDLYLLASQKNSNEALLFQAASLQIQFDKELAAQTFSQICRIGTKHVHEASWNRLVLLFETNKFGEILLAKDQFIRQIPKEKGYLLPYFLGRSYFELEDYSRCKTELFHFVEEPNASNEELKHSYITLIECARREEDLSMFDQYFSRLEKDFPGAEEIGDILLVRALIHRKKHYFQEAKKDLEVILEKYPEIAEQDLLGYEYARTLYDIENWVDSRKAFKKFIDDFEKHPYKEKAWTYFIQASMNHAEKGSSKDPFAKDQLAFDLEKILEEKELLDGNEKKKYQFLLAKTNYEIGAYEEASTILENFLKNTPSKDRKGDAILLLALCYKKGENNLHLFSELAEKALRETVTIMDESQIHFELYNTYLLFINDVQDENLVLHQKSNEIVIQKGISYNVEMETQAAEHLYLAHKTGGKIQLDNLIWLIDFFLDSYQKNDNRTFIVRARELLEDLFFKDTKIIQFTPKNIHLESYVLKLVEILEKMGDYKKSREILVQLHAQQTLQSNLSWKTLDQTLYLLGQKTLKEDKKQALKYFEEILNKSKSLTISEVAKACLWHARTEYELLDTNQKILESPEIQSILSKLKSLSIQRVLEHEPIHLEAAYDYIEIKSSLVEEDLSDHMRLDLLEKTIKNFSSKDDVLSKDYHARREQSSIKNDMFYLYLQFFKAEALFCKSRLAKKVQHKEDEQIYGDEAMRAYNDLLKKPKLTDYLRKKINDRLQQFS